MSTDRITEPVPADPAYTERVTGVDITEHGAPSINGGLGLLVVLVVLGVGALLLAQSPVPGIVLVVLGALLATGITIVNPGDAKVVQFFGRYLGTVRRAGLIMTVPLSTTKKASAIVVWQVSDTAKSVFAVENAEEFVAVQSESALRHIAGAHPYDNAEPGQETLRGSTESVAAELADEVAARIVIAGLTVIETRISSLSYAPEIAQAMLQRQQAAAVIAAREKIVEGAVSMVSNALDRLEGQDIVQLDDERKAAMVSNLLVVLCSDSRATPVVNAGTLYT